MVETTLTRLLSTEEAACFLGISPGTLIVWRCTGRYQLPFLKIGRLVRYDERDLRAFVESRRVGAREQPEAVGNRRGR